MKGLLEIYEGILDDDFDSKADDIVLKQVFQDWLDIPGLVKKNANIEVKDGKIYTDDISIYIGLTTEPIPEPIKIERARGLTLNGCQGVFDKCKHQFPKKVRSVSFNDIDIKDFKIETFNADFHRDVKSIKNLTLVIPEQRLGLTKNVFYVNFKTRKRNIEGLKIDGVNNIIVNCRECEIGDFMTNQIKYEVATYKRKNGAFKTQLELDKFIMEKIYEHLPMKHIDKYWKGVRRIIFKDRSGGLASGVGLGFMSSSYLKPGDFLIEKVGDEWCPIQKMFK